MTAVSCERTNHTDPSVLCDGERAILPADRLRPWLATREAGKPVLAVPAGDRRGGVAGAAPGPGGGPMTRQLSLFDNPKPPPRAAAADPASSHEAADRIRDAADRQAARVAAWVARHPGRTSRELAAVCNEADLDRHAFGRRLPEAADLGLVRRGELRPCTLGRGRAVTWWPPEPTRSTQGT